MRLSQFERLSVLACGTGIGLAAICFVVLGYGQQPPEWLPMAVASIAGFEMFMVFQAIRDRRAGGGSNG